MKTGSKKYKTWRSTPRLSHVLETDGEGNFRWVNSNMKVTLPKKSSKALTLPYKDPVTGKRSVVSLQKFVALIYHPRLNDEVATHVVDGDRCNLSKENVQWNHPSSVSKY